MEELPNEEELPNDGRLGGELPPKDGRAGAGAAGLGAAKLPAVGFGSDADRTEKSRMADPLDWIDPPAVAGAAYCDRTRWATSGRTEGLE